MKNCKAKKDAKLSRFVKSISLFLVMAFLMQSMPLVTVSAASVFAGGAGTKEDPYKIATVDQLNAVRYYLDKDFIQAANIDLTSAVSSGGAYYNVGDGWLPIGDNYDRFTGSYDGNGYTVRGLRINRKGTRTLYCGLFGYVSGVVKNIAITQCDIKAELSGIGATPQVGGIAGLVDDNSTIENCSVGGIITVLSDYTSYVGGIAGSVRGGSNSEKNIINCSNSAAITVTSKSSSDSSSIYTGGIIGYNDSSTRVVNCNNSGKLSVSASNNVYTGGIIGSGSFREITLLGDYNTGAIDVKVGSSGYQYPKYYSGGIAGTLEFYSPNVAGATTVVQNCYNLGSISAVADAASSYNYIGGTVGYAFNAKTSGSGSTNYLYNCQIINCYNMATISGSGAAFYNEAGGIVGNNSGFQTINCYNVGAISATTSKTSVSMVGAIVGYNQAAMINCYWDVSSDQIVQGVARDVNAKQGVGVSYGVDPNNIGITSISPATMKSSELVELLNGYSAEYAVWKVDATCINNGYPILVFDDSYIMSASALNDFGSLQNGYTQPTAQTVTITNTGTGAIKLIQPTSTDYIIGALSTTNLMAGGTATFTVQPKPMLAVGVHNETITIRGNNDATTTVGAQFSVLAATIYTITGLSVTDQNGNKLQNLINVRTFVVETELIKNLERDKEDCLIIGVYDSEDRLITLTRVKMLFDVHKTETFDVLITLPANTTAAKIKAFVWSDLSSMEPLSNISAL